MVLRPCIILCYPVLSFIIISYIIILSCLVSYIILPYLVISRLIVPSFSLHMVHVRGLSFLRSMVHGLTSPIRGPRRLTLCYYDDDDDNQPVRPTWAVSALYRGVRCMLLWRRRGTVFSQLPTSAVTSITVDHPL